MTNTTRNRILVAALLFLAFLADLLVTRGQFTPIVFAFSMLVAAYSLSPKDTLIASVAGLLLAMIAGIVDAEPLQPTLVSLITLATIAFMSCLISARTKAIKEREALQREAYAALLRVRERIVALARGESHGPVEIAGPPEVRDLTEAFNHMALEIIARESAERKASQRITQILESISDAFFALDDHLVVTYFNRAAEEVLGRKSEEALGRHLFEVFPEAKGSIFEEMYRRALGEKIPLEFETYFAEKPYENWYDVRVYPQETGISVYFRITTARKRAEEERTRLLASEQTARAEAVRYAGQMSALLESMADGATWIKC